MVASLVGRMPLSMIGLAVVLSVTGAGGSYGRAGAATALYTLAAGICAPVVSRAADRFGRRPVMLVAANLYAATLVVLAVVPARSALFLAVCAVAGITTPPVSASTNALWGDLLEGPARAAAYAVTATTQEIVYIAGPGLVAATALAAGPRAALLCCAAFALAGDITFACSAATHRPGGGRNRRPRPAPRLVRPLLPVLVGAIGITAGLSIVELAVVGTTRQAGQPSSSGLLLALWSVGSLLGGMALAPRVAHGRRGLLAALLVLCAAGFAALALAGSVPLLAVVLVAGGTMIAPAMAILSSSTALLSPDNRRTEAFGWLSTAFMAGSTLGAAAGGAAVQALGSRTTFLVAAAAPAAAAAWGVHSLSQRASPPPGPVGARNPEQNLALSRKMPKQR